mmetsp:Transcript_16133/g.21038  ORF Transcript_16133/g.21038 Transcript_16133/m.21038 type:complete len:665 (+) Transcript_16133:68-2062(+)
MKILSLLFGGVYVFFGINVKSEPSLIDFASLRNSKAYKLQILSLFDANLLQSTRRTAGWPRATASCLNIHQSRTKNFLLSVRGGETNSPSQIEAVDEVELTNAPIGLLPSGAVQRKFKRIADQNGRPAYKSESSEKSQIPVFLYWSGNQWMLNFDEDPSLNILNCIAYSKVDEKDPVRTSGSWYIRDGRRWAPATTIKVVASGTATQEVKKPQAEAGQDLPPILLPVFISFVIDNIGTGMVLPSLPFFIMDLGASPFQLGLVVAMTYMAQTLGCLVLGRISDRYGRRPVLLACVGGSVIAYYIVSISSNLYQVVFARMIGGLLGALVPVSQACIADQCPVDMRTKYLGILQASAGAGFVLGPLLGLVLRSLTGMSARGVFKMASLIALVGTTYTALKVKETKVWATQIDSSASSMIKRRDPLPLAISLLTCNGFLLMYAFSIETVYAMFIKDNFGYGESVLSTVFALNGVVVGILQVFFIKRLVKMLGKHMLLVFGNLLLANGMVGLAMIRQPFVHFSFFSLHILGYAIADTALSALISRYSSSSTQGLYLGLNQAAQSCARMISPLVAGILYERSKRMDLLPLGALPYLAGASAPLLAMAPPFFLYLRSVRKKIKESDQENVELKPMHRFLKEKIELAENTISTIKSDHCKEKPLNQNDGDPQ